MTDRLLEIGQIYTIAHDGFRGHIIGFYKTAEGKRGVVLQQIGTRVVHVYGVKWLEKCEGIFNQKEDRTVRSEV